MLAVNYWGLPHLVNRQGQITAADGRDVSFNDRALIMQYLVSASGLPPSGKWVSFLELPGGELHHVPFVEQALKPLARRFARDTQGFMRSGRLLGARAQAAGDCSFSVEAFPRLLLLAILWEEDEEFPARANILFDAVAKTSLSTASLWVLGLGLAHRLITGG